MNKHEPLGTEPELVAFSGPPLDEAQLGEAQAHLRRAHEQLVSWASHLRGLIQAAPGGLADVAARVNLDATVVRDLVLRPEEACLDHFFLVLTALQAAPAVPRTVVGGAFGVRSATLDFRASWSAVGASKDAELPGKLAA